MGPPRFGHLINIRGRPGGSPRPGTYSTENCINRPRLPSRSLAFALHSGPAPAAGLNGIQAAGANHASKALRVISTARLNVLPRVHLQPINLVVFQDSLGNTYLGACFALRCIQRLITAAHSYPAMQLTSQQVH